MNTKRFLKTLPILLLAAACTTGPERIDSALLSELQPGSMTRVVEARAVSDTADDAHAKAQRDTQWAEEQAELTRSSLKVARAGLDEAKHAMVVADRSGTVGQLRAAEHAHEYAIARVDEVRALLGLRKRELEYAKLAEKLALEELRLSRAQVELEKAEAIQELDRVAAKRIPLKDYQKQVRFHETEVELARVRLKAMAANVEDARAEAEDFRLRAEELMENA